ncbi:MAG: NAD(P)-dependent oxidoreductase, partial [Gammaproteobacteria bacterium]
MDYFPLFANLRDQPCLIVGGGRLAVRKAEVIARAGARIEVVAPDIDERLAALAATTHLRKFAPKDVEANVLVIAATSDRSVNKTVSDAAKARHIPVNVVDDAELSTVIFPSIVDRSPLVIAISTGGASPVLLRQLRTRLEALMPAAYGRLAEFAGRFRKRVADAVTDGDARRRFWERLLEGPVGEAVLTGREQAAERMLEDALGDEHHRIAQGEVY